MFVIFPEVKQGITLWVNTTHVCKNLSSMSAIKLPPWTVAYMNIQRIFPDAMHTAFKGTAITG